MDDRKKISLSNEMGLGFTIVALLVPNIFLILIKTFNSQELDHGVFEGKEYIVWFVLLFVVVLGVPTYFVKFIKYKLSTSDLAWLTFVLAISTPIAYFITIGKYLNYEMLILQETMALTIGMIVIFIARLVPDFDNVTYAVDRLEKTVKNADPYLKNLIRRTEEDNEKHLSDAILQLKNSTKDYIGDRLVPETLENPEIKFIEQRKNIIGAIRSIAEDFNDDEVSKEDTSLRSISMLSLFTSYFKFENLMFDTASPGSGMVQLSTSYDHYAEAIKRMIENVAVLNEVEGKDFHYEFYLFTDRSPHVWLQQTRPEPFKSAKSTAEPNPEITETWLDFLHLINHVSLKGKLNLYFSSVESREKEDHFWPLTKEKFNSFLDSIYVVCCNRSNEDVPELFFQNIKTRSNQEDFYEKYVGKTINRGFVDEVKTFFRKEYGVSVAFFEQNYPRFLTLQIEDFEKYEIPDKVPFSCNREGYVIKRFRELLADSHCNIYNHIFENDEQMNNHSHFADFPKNLFAVRKRHFEREKSEWKIIMGAQGRYSTQSAVKLLYSTQKRGVFGKNRETPVNNWDGVSDILNNIFINEENVEKITREKKENGVLGFLNPFSDAKEPS